mmetsp:Transcript_8608/g.18506  ORF Transcript_8608/g.18506 Transcript_8608/m.18506 type:complete len:227 (-) Transcript_8608:73-753(-)
MAKGHIASTSFPIVPCLQSIDLRQEFVVDGKSLRELFGRLLVCLREDELELNVPQRPIFVLGCQGCRALGRNLGGVGGQVGLRHKLSQLRRDRTLGGGRRARHEMVVQQVVPLQKLHHEHLVLVVEVVERREVRPCLCPQDGRPQFHDRHLLLYARGGQRESVGSEYRDIFRGLLDEDGFAAGRSHAEREVHVTPQDRLGCERRVGRENADLGGVFRHVVGDRVLG